MLLGEFLGLDWQLVTERRGDVAIEADGMSVAYRDGLFATEAWLEPASLPRPPHPLPLLWERDPFGTAFFCLTRYEEVVLRDHDERDRFRAAAATEPSRPLVNELLEELWRELQAAWPRLERRRRVFRVLPTHDIDVPSCRTRSPRRLAADVLRHRAPGLALRRLGGADPCDTYDWLMDVSEQRGLESAFYFIADDEEYVFESIVPIIRAIHERGHEVGLHGSYHTYRDGARLARELERLRSVGVHQDRWGGRQHFLRFRAPETWRHWDDAGLDYDSTVGWSDAAGFRAGVCYAFPVFDLERSQMLRLRERPLVVMETTFVQHLALGEKALSAMTAMKNACRRYDGDFVLLWHNNRLSTARDRRLYEAILDA